MKRPIRRPNVRRAAPALPNGFTLGNLFFGIFAIISASRGEFSRAVLFIVLGVAHLLVTIGTRFRPVDAAPPPEAR